MGFCLAILYGFFELGDFKFMNSSLEKYYCLGAVVILAIFLYVVFWISIYSENSNDSVKIYYCNNSVLRIENADIDSFFVLCKKDATVPAKKNGCIFFSGYSFRK